MFKRRLLRSVLLFAALAGISDTGFAATLDVSGYTTGTPLNAVSTPGFTFIVSPGVGARVYDDRLEFYNGVPGVDVRIVFSGNASWSDMYFWGYGSCQVGRDYISWYFDDALIDSFDTFTPGPGRCRDNTYVSRSFEHNEIRLDIADGEQMHIFQLTNDVPVPRDAAPVPSLSGWALALLSGLMLIGAAIKTRETAGTPAL